MESIVIDRWKTSCHYKNALFFITLLIGHQYSSTQQVQKPSRFDLLTKIRPYGYIRLDSLGDSRQIIEDANNAELIFPAPVLLDPTGKDINAHAQYHLTYVETRVGLEFLPIPWPYPDGETFSIMGLIEGDFSGRTTFDVGSYVLRHAYGELLWKTGTLLFGQFWHPLVIVDCAPGVISYNGGVPIVLFARNPQLRVTQHFDDFEFAFTIASQRDFPSPGPLGPINDYIRDAIVPNINAQLRYNQDNYFIGTSIDYKRLVPRLESNKGFKVNEQVNSVIAQVFGAFFYKNCELRAKTFYAQNGADLEVISGYGVSSIDPVTDFRTYTPTQAVAGWFDGIYHLTDDLQLGIFFGYIKNLGALDTLVINPKTKQPIIYSFLDVSQNVDFTVRLSPRCVYTLEPFQVATELEYTGTSWGTPNKTGKVTNGVLANNVRLLVNLSYLF